LALSSRCPPKTKPEVLSPEDLDQISGVVLDDDVGRLAGSRRPWAHRDFDAARAQFSQRLVEVADDYAR
jgi:hypothetical protein